MDPGHEQAPAAGQRQPGKGTAIAPLVDGGRALVLVDNGVAGTLGIVVAGAVHDIDVDDGHVAGLGGDPVLPPEEFALSAQPFYDNALPELSWTLSINATQYEVEFARDEAFTDIAFATVTTGLSFQAQTGDLDPGVYYARVTAVNPIGELSKSGVIGLDMPCPADLDGNGVKDLQDINRFVSDFLSVTCD